MAILEEFLYTSRPLVTVAGLYGGVWPVLVYALGWLFSFISLVSVGSVALTHLGIRWQRKPSWAFLFSAGMVASAVYFVIRSFVCKLAPFIPGVWPGEVLIFAAVAVWPVRHEFARGWVKVLRQRLSWVWLAVILISLAASGWWAFLNPVPLSSDPGAIAGFLEVYRFNGQVPFVMSEANRALLGYPSGFLVVVWTLLNPLVSSLSAVHGWPVLSYTMAVAMIAEALVFGSRLRPARQAAVLVALMVFAKLCWLGEVYPLSPFQEGVAKKSVYLPLVFGFVLSFWCASAAAQRARPVQQAAAFTLALVGLMAPFLVNPINFAVSFSAVCAGGFLFCWPRLRRQQWRVVLAAVALSSCYFVLALVQEPLFLARISYGSNLCEWVYDRSLAKCQEPQLEQWQMLAQVGDPKPDDKVSAITSWTKLLPQLSRDPVQLLLPSNQGQVASPWVLAWPLAGLLVGFLRLALYGAGRGWRRVGAASALIFGTLWLFFLATRFQVWLFFQATGVEQRKLIPYYSDQAYLNLYTPLVLGLVGCGVYVVIRILGSSALPGVMGRLRPVSCHWAAALFFVSAVAVTSLATVPAFREVKGKSSFKRLHQLVSFHADARQVKRAVGWWRSPGNGSIATVVLPSTAVEIMNEHWLFPDYRAYALGLINSFEVYNSFSPLARPEPYTVFQLNERVCNQLCAIRGNQRLTHIIIKGEPKTCFAPVEHWLNMHKGCLRPVELLGRGSPSLGADRAEHLRVFALLPEDDEKKPAQPQSTSQPPVVEGSSGGPT